MAETIIQEEQEVPEVQQQTAKIYTALQNILSKPVYLLKKQLSLSRRLNCFFLFLKNEGIKN